MRKHVNIRVEVETMAFQQKAAKLDRTVETAELEDLFLTAKHQSEPNAKLANRGKLVLTSCMSPSRCPVPSIHHQAFNAKASFFKLKKEPNLGALLKTIGDRPLGQCNTVLWYNVLYERCKAFARESYLFTKIYHSPRRVLHHECENCFIFVSAGASRLLDPTVKAPLIAKT